MFRFPCDSSHEVDGTERSGDKRTQEGPKEVGRKVRVKTGDSLHDSERTDSDAPPGREPSISGHPVHLVYMADGGAGARPV